MSIQCLHAPLLCLAVAATVSGCTQEDLERLANRETLAFEGTYDNQYDQQLLVFKEGRVSIHQQGDEPQWQHTFQVEESLLNIRVRQSSREKRDDLVMRIHGGGEVLTCSACARLHLSNVWVRQNAAPQNAATASP